MVIGISQLISSTDQSVSLEACRDLRSELFHAQLLIEKNGVDRRFHAQSVDRFAGSDPNA